MFFQVNFSNQMLLFTSLTLEQVDRAHVHRRCRLRLSNITVIFLREKRSIELLQNKSTSTALLDAHTASTVDSCIPPTTNLPCRIPLAGGVRSQP